MIKQLRAVIFENGTNKAANYANELFDGLNIEASVVNVYDKRPATQILPVRAIPNVAVLLFADTLEEGQQIVDVVRQLDYIAGQEEAEAVGAKLIADGYEAGTVDGTQAVDSMILLPLYKAEGIEGDYWHEVNESCTHDGQPWRCCQRYNAKNNPDIVPGSAPAHWVQYHTTDPNKALPFVHPTGAHDVYNKGECMVYTDGMVYQSNMDNNSYSPEEYAQGWDLVTEE